MAGPPRQQPPSAIDGYRRLARTRAAAAPAAPVVARVGTAAPHRRRPGVGTRVTGALRLTAFIAVLAIIVGTSVGLASADTRAERPRAAAAEQRRPTRSEGATRLAAGAGPDVEAAVTPTKVAQPTKAPAVERAATSTPVVAAAPVRRQPAAGSTRELPFTGPEATLDRVLLGGAGLVLLGMLVQIAGQPLPARSVVRTR